MFFLFSLFSDFGFCVSERSRVDPGDTTHKRAFVCANEAANKASAAFAVSDVASS